MSAADGDTAAHLDTQPHAIVERDGVRYTLLGTAHVSRASIDAVRAEVVVEDIDLARSETVRRIWPFLRDRRIDAYDELLLRFRD